MTLLAHLIAAILVMWEAWTPGASRIAPAPRIARAIASAVLEDAAAGRPPVYGSHAEDAAEEAFFAARESSLDPTAVGDGGKSFGVWQMRGACAHVSVEEQAVCWLAQLHASTCTEHPVATFWGKCTGRVPYGRVEVLADERERRARRMLRSAIAYGM